MSSSCSYLSNLFLVSMLLIPLGILLANSYSPPEQHILCNAGERSALLQFKKSFVIDESASLDPLAYPKIRSWTLQSDCCSWDGVYCDEEVDGHVIGLELGSSCLFGSIYSNSTLFKLKHLQRLILADNHFNYSPIPPELALFSTTLTHLNLSRSYFAGQIPPEISTLSRLTVLDLGLNYDPSSSTWLLQLKKPIFSSLVQNMSNLEFLALSWVDISSTVPNLLSNLSSLSRLCMRSCNLVGEFPSNVFLLPNIHRISIRYNEELTGHLPQFNHSTLKLLMLSNTRFSVPISSSLGLDNLEVLFLSSCKLSGQIPFLIQNLTKLERLDLGYNSLRGSLPTPPPSIIYYIVSHNRLTGEIPSLFCNLSSMSYLELNHNNLSGKLPHCLGNMTNLSLLTVNNNHFHGTIPPMCGNGTIIMEVLSFAENHLQGKLPTSLAKCAMLRSLNVGHNQINDTFPFWMGKLDDLQLLILRSNKFRGPIESYASANDSEFPNLRIIDLSRNEFFGHLPSALFHKWKAMKKSSQIDFTYMHLNRSFSIFLVEETTAYSAFSMILANKGNEMKYGKIPNEFAAVDFSSNNFIGEIPRSIGNLNGLYMLNLSNNYLTGPIVPSLANLSEIESLDLSNNKLSGEIPQQLAKLSFLAMLNVSHNNLTGQVPRGKQLDTFQDNSFEGNLGLCGELLINKRCKSYTPPSIAPVCLGNCEEVESSSFPGKWADWIIITAGYVGGLIVGFVIGNTLMAKKPKWFIKVFGKKMKPQTRRARRRC